MTGYIEAPSIQMLEEETGLRSSSVELAKTRKVTGEMHVKYSYMSTFDNKGPHSSKQNLSLKNKNSPSKIKKK